MAVLEEELGDDEIRALIDLGLEPLPVDVFAFAAGDVALRKPCDADRKAAGRADMPDQLVRVLKTAVGPDELADAARRVTPQSEDVLDPSSLLRSRIASVSSIVAFTHVRCAIAVTCSSR